MFSTILFHDSPVGGVKRGKSPCFLGHSTVYSTINDSKFHVPNPRNTATLIEAVIGVELGVASWRPPHPKNFRPSRNFCRPSRNLLTWLASTNFGGQTFQKFFLKQKILKIFRFCFYGVRGYSLYAVRPTRSHMNSTPVEAVIQLCLYRKLPSRGYYRFPRSSLASTISPATGIGYSPNLSTDAFPHTSASIPPASVTAMKNM